MKISFTVILLVAMVLRLAWTFWQHYKLERVTNQSACETDKECIERDKKLLKRLKAITAVTNAKSNDHANAVVGDVVDVYGNTLRWPHMLYADFERVSNLIYAWEKDNIKLPGEV